MEKVINSPSIKPLISRRELSFRLGISPTTIVRLEKAGSIHGIRVGGQYKYQWDSVIENLKSKEVSRGY